MTTPFSHQWEPTLTSALQSTYLRDLCVIGASVRPDHETAMSAVRNLNNTDVGGRPLRIDLADSDPFLEGKTTVHGEIVDGGGETRAQWRERERRERDGSDEAEYGFLKSLPPGVPLASGLTSMDAITQLIATTPPPTMYEVLAQMKVEQQIELSLCEF